MINPSAVDMKFLQELENRLCLLEERLSHYASQIVSETPTPEVDEGESLLQSVNRGNVPLKILLMILLSVYMNNI